MNPAPIFSVSVTTRLTHYTGIHVHVVERQGFSNTHWIHVIKFRGPGSL